jgi:hypothetical protein
VCVCVCFTWVMWLRETFQLVGDAPYFYVETPEVNLLKVFPTESDTTNEEEHKVPLQFGRYIELDISLSMYLLLTPISEFCDHLDV